MTRWAPGPGIEVLEAENLNGNWIVNAVGPGSGRCPGCSFSSTSRHSRYVRRLQDLPAQGVTVALNVTVDRWRCRNPGCKRKTFSDQIRPIAYPFARRTCRVSELAHLIGHSAGGRPAERLMKRLGLSQSDDTILRQLKRHQAQRGAATPVRVAGIDDWSWRKGSSYGTIVVDLERREVVDILMDRSAAWPPNGSRSTPKSRSLVGPRRPLCGGRAPGCAKGVAGCRPLPSLAELARNNRAATEPRP
jgi:transposase